MPETPVALPQEVDDGAAGFKVPAGGAMRRDADLGEASSDILQLVKPRSDWWDEGPLKSPVKELSMTTDEDPLDKFILALPIPAYGILGLAGVAAIAFVGCILSKRNAQISQGVQSQENSCITKFT